MAQSKDDGTRTGWRGHEPECVGGSLPICPSTLLFLARPPGTATHQGPARGGLMRPQLTSRQARLPVLTLVLIAS